MITIKETIVVEGRDDETAVKKAVKGDIIITHGFGITEKTFKRIAVAQEKCGVIILTDPDFAGEQIRKRISKRIKGCKHAFLPREEARKKDDIGIENATPENIVAALEKIHTIVDEQRKEFTITDLIRDNLNGSPAAVKRRDVMGKILGIGYGNGKQFIHRLNHYGISREEYEKTLGKLEKESD